MGKKVPPDFSESGVEFGASQLTHVHALKWRHVTTGRTRLSVILDVVRSAAARAGAGTTSTVGTSGGGGAATAAATVAGGVSLVAGVAVGVPRLMRWRGARDATAGDQVPLQ